MLSPDLPQPDAAPPTAGLAFVGQPGRSVVGAAVAPAVQVAVTDSAGKTITSATHTITLSLARSPGGGAVSGTLTAGAVKGVATFFNVKIDKAAPGYALVAATAGATNGLSDSFDVVAARLPAAPAGLTAVPGDGEVTLLWSPVSGASRYVVLKSMFSGGPYTGAGMPVDPVHHDEKLSNGKDLYYVVRTINAAGTSLGASNEVKVTPSYAHLKAPTELSARAGNGEVTLDWRPVTSAGSYEVLRAIKPGGPYAKLPPAFGPTATDRSLTNGQSYYYAVRAVSSTASAYSLVKKATPSSALPKAPQSLSAKAGSTWAGLSWAATAGASRYVLYRAATSGGPYSAIAHPKKTSFDDTKLSNGNSYYYVVTAVSPAGRSALSKQVVAAVSAAGPPRAPVLSAARNASGTLTLSWDKAAGAVSYRVYRGTTSGGPYSDLGIQTSSFVDSAVAAGTAYYYVVDALNASPIAARSKEVSAAVTTAKPAPTGLKAHAGNTAVTLTWTPVEGATQYQLDWSLTSGGPYNSTSVWDEAIHDLTGLTNGVTYYYRLKVSSPFVSSSCSAEVSATPSSTLPLATTDTWAHVGNSAVTVTWDVVSGATGYEIHRRSEGAWSKVATVTSGPYNDTGLQNGVGYSYNVAAVNASGAGAWSSYWPWSEAIPSATAPPAPTGLVVIPGNTEVTVRWDAVEGADKYTAAVATSPGGQFSGASTCGSPYSCLGYDHSGLTNGSTYYYSVRAGSQSSNSIYLAPPLGAKPSSLLPLAPQSYWFDIGNTEAFQQWDAVAGATGYKIYRRVEGGAWGLIATVGSTSYADTKLTNGVAYSWAVAAVNAAGSGAWASDWTSSAPTGRAWVAPAGVTARAGSGEVTVSWDPLPGVKSYRLYSSSTPGGPYSQVTGNSYPQKDTSFTLSGLTNGATRYFAVRANDPKPGSVYSAEVSATPSASLPPAPTGIYGSAGVRQVTLGWKAVSGATGYEVYWRSETSGWYLIGATTTNAYTDLGVSGGVISYYMVAAVNAAGSGARASWVVKVTPGP